MVYSRDFYVAYGADTVLILYGDTLAATSGIISSVLSDGVTITGDGTTGSELTVDTTTVIATKGDLSDYVTVAGTQTITGAKTFSTGIVVNQNGNNVDTRFEGDTDANLLFLDADANKVGIGLSTPSEILHIRKNQDAVTQMRVENQSNTANARASITVGTLGNAITMARYLSNYTLTPSFASSGAIFTDSGLTNGFFFRTAAGPIRFQPAGTTDRVVFNTSGDVGIGTSSPSYKLDVNGNVRADTYYYDVTSTLQSSSDSRLKQNITDMDNVLDKLKELELVKYEWNDNMYKKLEGRTSQSKLGGTFEGMIAQQVESLFPQYVGEDADGYKTLSYVSFVIPLLKGFQEQQAIIENQSTEIETLKTLITELSNRLTILENN
jgi:hypothetical protein